MRTISLIFCLLLLLLGIPLILFGNLLHWAFAWQDLLMYVVIAAVIYAIVFANGWSLNKNFNVSIEQFLDGRSAELAPRKSLLRTFGLLLFVLLPYLIFLLLFAVLAAIMFGLYGLWLLGQLERVPIALLIGLAIVVLGTIYAFFIGIYRLFFPPSPKMFGQLLSREDAPELTDLVLDVAAKVGTKRVDRIVVTPQPGVSVHLEGSMLSTIFGGGKRILQLGIPSLHSLTVSEFSAILAHEYGHFSNRDTQWSSFTYAMGNSLTAAFKATPGPISIEGERKGLIWFALALNPAYWILLLFLHLFIRVTSAFSRTREVMADIKAMQLYAGESFAKGLSKVVFNDVIFSGYVEGKTVPLLLEQQKTITNLAFMMTQALAALPVKVREDIQSESVSTKPSAYDSHPAVSVRLNYSGRFGLSSPNPDQRDISTLFADWTKLNEEIAQLYYNRLVEYFRAVAAAQHAQQSAVSTNG